MIVRALLLAAFLVTSAARAECDVADLIDGVAECPLPAGVFGTDTEAILNDASQRSTSELQSALLALATKLRATPENIGLAENIERAVRSAPASNTTFAQVSNPVAADVDVASCACSWVTGRPHDDGTTRVCYRVKVEHAPACARPVRSFDSWADAAPIFLALRLANKGLTSLASGERSAALAALVTAKERWSRLRDNGYVQYPWELAASLSLQRYRSYQSCFAADARCTGAEGLSPERLRLIFLHPSAALAFQGFGKRGKPSADAEASLNIEVAGVTFYTRSFRQYVGASLAAGFVGANFAEPRVGPFVHITRWLHVGYLWCVAGDARKDASLMVSFDVASWLSKWTGKSFLPN